jgi:hypothetical protein
MKKIIWLFLIAAVGGLGMAALCFGHACDDPWRPNPGSAGAAPGGPGSAPEAPAPPPPPPAPGESGGPGSIAGPGSVNALGMGNRLPGETAPQSGQDETSPDNIVLIPEASQLKIIGRKGEFRTYIVNKSPRDLFDVKLQAVSPAFDTEVDPASLRRLVAGEREYYTVKLKLKDDWKSGKFPMDFKVTSRGATIYEGNLDGSGGSAAAQNLGLTLSQVPAGVAQKAGFKVYLKNNVFNELNNIVLTAKSETFDLAVKPASVKKLSPGQAAEFEVALTVKKGSAPGKYKVTLDGRTSSRNVFAAQELTLDVKKK